MSEPRKLWIPGRAGKLEAMLRVAPQARASAVVAHPHPLHGGTLHNPVVFHSDRELHRSGMTTLRFNFRGVGESDGDHDDGRGEVDDVGAAVSWLRGVVGDRPALLVGYSFGFWCSIRHAAGDDRLAGLIALGMPTRRYAFDELERLRCPVAAVQGSEDELGSPDEVRAALELAPINAGLWAVDGATHLFPRQADEAARAVVAAAAAILALR